MKKRIAYLISFVLLISVVSCTTSSSIKSSSSIKNPPSASASGPRTIILDGDSISEKDFGEFKSWYCKDFIHDGDVLVEVGYFSDPAFEGFGFILYDGGYTGVSTAYRRMGLEHRWNWGTSNENTYSFVIETDGTGAYFDFTNVPDGESTKPSAIYKCYQR